MRNRVDLHIHTVVSDGLHTPTEIVGMARELGLQTISITDHDAIDGIPEAMDAASGTDLEVIPGVEISVDAEGVEVHMLGYFVDHTSQDLVRALDVFRAARVERAQAMIARLRTMGVALSWDRVVALASGGVVGRAHIARALEKARHVSSISEAFDRFIGKNQPAYVSRVKMSAVDTLHLIRRAGGLPVVAHPWGSAFVVPGLVQEGLVGLEVYYPRYTPELISCLRRLAERYGLVCTGGSDFHGLALLPDNRLGEIRVPAECVEDLRECRRALYETSGQESESI